MFMNEKDYVASFNSDERNLIVEACDEFIAWSNLHTDAEHKDITVCLGRAMIVKDLFIKPLPCGNELRPCPTNNAVFHIIKDYREILRDFINDSIGLKDDADRVASLNAAIITCNSLLERLLPNI